MNPLKLLFIRHAQSVGNQQKRMQGWGEYELSEEGKVQAEKLARRLITEAWRPTHIYSSPLRRAAQTAEIVLANFLAEPLPAAVSDLVGGEIDSPLDILAQQPHADIQIAYADELKEFQNGIFTGLTWAEARSLHPQLCHTLENSLDWIAIPGAETLQDARDRTHHFLQQILEKHTNGDRLLVVTHSWILQHLLAQLLGSDRSWRIPTRNTAIFEFWIERSRWQRDDHSRFNTDLWQIRRFNDCQHL